MKALTIATVALSLLTVGHVSQASTPGYDRPGPEQKQPDGHQHLVYWATFFDGMSAEMQDLADASSTDQIVFKGDPHAQQERERHAKATSSAKASSGR